MADFDRIITTRSMYGGVPKKDGDHSDSDSDEKSYRHKRVLHSIEEANHENGTETSGSEVGTGRNNRRKTNFKFQTPSSIYNTLRREKQESMNLSSSSELYKTAFCSPIYSTPRTTPHSHIRSISNSFSENDARLMSVSASTRKAAAWVRTQLLGDRPESPDLYRAEVRTVSNSQIQHPAYCTISDSTSSTNNTVHLFQPINPETDSESGGAASFYEVESNIESTSTDLRTNSEKSASDVEFWQEQESLGFSVPEQADYEMDELPIQRDYQQVNNENRDEYFPEYCYLYGKKFEDVIAPILKEMDETGTISFEEGDSKLASNYNEEINPDSIRTHGSDTESALNNNRIEMCLIDEEIGITHDNDGITATEMSHGINVHLETSVLAEPLACSESSITLKNNSATETKAILDDVELNNVMKTNIVFDTNRSLITDASKYRDNPTENYRVIRDNVANYVKEARITSTYEENCRITKDNIDGNSNEIIKSDVSKTESKMVENDLGHEDSKANNSTLTQVINQLDDEIRILNIRKDTQKIRKYPNVIEVRSLEIEPMKTKFGPDPLIMNTKSASIVTDKTYEIAIDTVSSSTPGDDGRDINTNVPEPSVSTIPEKPETLTPTCKVPRSWKPNLESTRQPESNINSSKTISPTTTYCGGSTLSAINMNSPTPETVIDVYTTPPSGNAQTDGHLQTTPSDESAPSPIINLNTPLSTKPKQDKNPPKPPRKSLLESAISHTNLNDKPIVDCSTMKTPAKNGQPGTNAQAMAFWIGTSISPIAIVDAPKSDSDSNILLNNSIPQEVDNFLEHALGDEMFSSANTEQESPRLKVEYSTPQQTSPSINSILSSNTQTPEPVPKSRNASFKEATLTLCRSVSDRFRQTFRLGKKEPKSPPPPEPEIPHIPEPNAKVKKLLQEVEIQQTLIYQASKALNACESMKKFSNSLEHIESERMILLASLRKKAALDEIRKETSKPRENKTFDNKAQVMIKDISLAVRDGTLPREQYKKEGVIEWFVVVMTQGVKVSMTHAEPCPLDFGSRIYFPGTYLFSNVTSEFEIRVTVYSLKIRSGQLNGGDKNKCKNKHVTCPNPATLLKKRTISPNPFEIKMNGIRESAFTHCANVTLSLNDIKVMSPWPLKLTSETILYGTIDLKLKCELPVTECQAGFVNYGEKIGDAFVWNLLWCVLEGRTISFWTYPTDREAKPPVLKIDLTYCITERITGLGSHQCTKPRTLLLETVRQRTLRDRNSIVVESSSTFMVSRHYIYVEQVSEFMAWKGKLNNVMRTLREWKAMNAKRDPPVTDL